MPHLSVCRRMSEYSTIHATALQVNRPHLPRGSETKSRLGIRDKIAIESDADLPVEKVEQDYDAFAITHALEQPKATRHPRSELFGRPQIFDVSAVEPSHIHLLERVNIR